MIKNFVVALLFLTAVMASTTQAAGGERLKLATTTSTENSGLPKYLLPYFEKGCGCTVDVIAVGTGQALKLGANGDVDVVMVHAPSLEETFVQQGYGVGRRTFMKNEFVIVGPAADPAGVRGVRDAAAALAKIRERRALFISRGDESGTHQREKELWNPRGISPKGDWYKEAGQGMGAVLTMAQDMRAYTLTDLSTYVARANQSGLEVLLAGDPNLANPYSIIAVNPQKAAWAKFDLAERLTAWLCSKDGQRLIGAYEVKGTQLFLPTIVSGG